MTPAPIPAPVQAFAPSLAIDVARRFGLIMAGLAAVVAHRFLKDPRFAAPIIPLWTRLNRASGRFARLMDRVAINACHNPARQGPIARRPPPPPARPRCPPAMPG